MSDLSIGPDGLPILPLDPLPDWPLDELPVPWAHMFDVDDPDGYDPRDYADPPPPAWHVYSPGPSPPPDDPFVHPPRLDLVPPDYDDELEAAIERILAHNARTAVPSGSESVHPDFADHGDPLDDADYWDWLWGIFVPDEAAAPPLAPSYSAGQLRTPSSFASSMPRTGFVDNMLSHGLDLMRTSHHGYRISSRSLKHGKWLASQVALWEQHGVVSRSKCPKFCLPIFAVPKGLDKLRCVYDATLYNACIPTPPKIRLPRPQKVIDEAHSSGMRWMTKLDLSDAFLTVPLRDSQLGFQLKDKFYTWQRMPFGIKQAPFILHTLTKTIRRFAVDDRSRIFSFYDDFLVLGRTKKDAHECTSRLIRALNDVGFKINMKKSELGPTQQITFLGCVVNLADYTVRQAHKRVKSVLRLLWALERNSIPLKMAQRVMGVLMWVAQTNVTLRPLLRPICSSLGRASGRRFRFRLPYALLRSIVASNPPLRPHTRPHCVAFTDATPTTMACIVDGETFSKKFDKEKPIFIAELAAITCAVIASPTPHTIVYADNQAANYASNKLRSSNMLGCLLLLHLAKHLVHTGKTFSVRYIRSAFNPADAPSRAHAQYPPAPKIASLISSVLSHRWLDL